MKRAPFKELPSQEELLRLFVYDPASGLLTWKERDGARWFNAMYAGKMAGSAHGPYIRVHIGSESFGAHRIIWKMVTGEEPEFIDHIDGCEANNSWPNLRDVSHDQNMWNTKLFHNNTSGFRGVSFIKAHGQWRAAISIKGKKKHLGYYSSAEAAHEAFVAASCSIRDEFARVA